MSKNKKVAIITGVTSFLGRSTAKYLLGKGFVVLGIVRPDSLNIGNLKSIDGLNIIKLDFEKLSSSDFKNLQEVSDDNIEILDTIKNIKSKNVDLTFIHYAWGHTLDRNNFAKQMMNIDTSLKVLEFAKILNADRFIFAGSQAEKSETAYGMAKKQFSIKAISDLKMNKMQFIHFLIFSIYGREDRETSMLKQLVQSFKDNRDFSLSSCEYKWNFLYIDDYVDILYKFIINDVKSGNYDIASDDTRDLKEYVKEAYSVYGAKNKLLFGDMPDSSETFAIPNIKNTIDVIGEYSFTKFSKGIESLK